MRKSVSKAGSSPGGSISSPAGIKTRTVVNPSISMEVLRAKDFSETKFQEVIKANERILAAPWNRALTRTLQETAALVQEFQDALFRHKGSVQQLEDVTVGAVENGGDVDRMLAAAGSTMTAAMSSGWAVNSARTADRSL